MYIKFVKVFDPSLLNIYINGALILPYNYSWYTFFCSGGSLAAKNRCVVRIFPYVVKYANVRYIVTFINLHILPPPDVISELFKNMYSRTSNPTNANSKVIGIHVPEDVTWGYDHGRLQRKPRRNFHHWEHVKSIAAECTRSHDLLTVAHSQ